MLVQSGTAIMEISVECLKKQEIDTTQYSYILAHSHNVLYVLLLRCFSVFIAVSFTVARK